MKVLFVHQNFPGQYLHLARRLGADPGNEIVFLTQRRTGELPGVRKIVYQPARAVTRGVHRYLHDTEAHVLNAQGVARAASRLRKEGFVPDVMLGHNGWGEPWYLKDVYPDVPLIGYFEFFYRLQGADVGFEPGAVVGLDDGPRLRTKNLGNLIGLDAVDVGQCPTQWQKSLYPAAYLDKLHVLHEGVDTLVVKPDDEARLVIPGTSIELSPKDEVVTYVARNLEPYRGFPSFMRSLPAILARRPQARVLVVGGDQTSYGPRPAGGGTFRERLLAELGAGIDRDRVHFLGRVPYPLYLRILQVSTAHVYLTYPFVLSWSMLEAMSAGCVVVGSSTAPVQEAIRDGHTGILVDMFDIARLSEAIIDVLSNRGDYDDLRVRARRKIVDEYDLQRICLPAQLRLLGEAASRGPSRRSPARLSGTAN